MITQVLFYAKCRGISKILQKLEIRPEMKGIRPESRGIAGKIPG
ncbi:hypothetical protein [Succinimonas amylolytica]|nr:hypothetical protein [Succinimonas amylolytica]